MQQKIFNMLEVDGNIESLADAKLSFKPFLDFVRKQLDEKGLVKRELLEYILNKFESFEIDDIAIALDQLPAYKELLALLFMALTNVTEDENKIYWGLCVPMTPIMFYGSEALYQLLEDANQHDLEFGMDIKEYQVFTQTKMEHFYTFIFEKFYQTYFPKKRGLIRTIKDKRTGQTRHFSINLDTTFVEVKSKTKLPALDPDLVRRNIMAENSTAHLQTLIPVNIFSFSGITIMTATDISQQYALETIKNIVVKNQGYSVNYGFPEIAQALKELTCSNEIEFNILPLFKFNGKLAVDMELYNRSILFSAAKKTKFTDAGCLGMMEEFVSTPELFYYSNFDSAKPEAREAINILQSEGIKSYTLLPVFYNGKLVGAIEAFSESKGLFSAQFFSVLESAKELLSQLMYNCQAAIEAEIELVIQEKYTRLQPSVQWKFVEVAWHHLQSKKGMMDIPNPDQEVIGFENVYPLYGAVDIRNSTIERNAALLKDNTIQFSVLHKVLHQLKQKTGFGLLDEKIFAANKWEEVIRASEKAINQQEKLNDFLENNILPFLKKFTHQRPELHAIAEPYFQSIDDATGIAFENRRRLESSMSKVITGVNRYFDQLKDEIQQAFPCYFEKIRTDGVEYDIYIGQSISPDLPYSDIYLKNLRLMQLTSMAAIASYTHSLLPDLSNPIQTTQLIFIHSQPIDILFRNDEKRFDVEGAYNIRYHIIKKRIDKVHLKDSRERLTQPNKIALVYFSDKEAGEYISYIQYLQADHILNDDLEKLELEDLAGVSGLKALRVSVNIEVNIQQNTG